MIGVPTSRNEITAELELAVRPDIKRLIRKPDVAALDQYRCSPIKTRHDRASLPHIG